jgi:lactoylglutathione lyase
VSPSLPEAVRSDAPHRVVVNLTLDHGGMSVADIGRSTHFYTEVFGFAVEESFAIPNTPVTGRVLIHPGGARIELFRRDDSQPRATGHPVESTLDQGWFQIAFRVDDTRSVFSRIVAGGANPVKEPFVAPDGRSTVAFVGDPDGNLIELIQRQHS